MDNLTNFFNSTEEADIPEKIEMVKEESEKVYN